MKRKIEGTIYRLTYFATVRSFVECGSQKELFEYIAQELIDGRIVVGVNEMCKDGSTPKVKVFTDRDFKKILKSYKNPKKILYATH